MAAELDELVNDAVEARLELAHRRSKYPNPCSNKLMRTVKCDIKTSMTFEIDTGNDIAITTKYKNNEAIDQLGLKNNDVLSEEKLEDLKEQLAQVSQVLTIIGKNKTNKRFPGEGKM